MDKTAYVKGGDRVRSLENTIAHLQKLVDTDASGTDRDRRRELIVAKTQEIEQVKKDPFYTDWW